MASPNPYKSPAPRPDVGTTSAPTGRRSTLPLILLGTAIGTFYGLSLNGPSLPPEPDASIYAHFIHNTQNQLGGFGFALTSMFIGGIVGALIGDIIARVGRIVAVRLPT